MKDVYYLGPKGSFSYILAAQLFSNDSHSLVPSDTFSSIVKNLDANSLAILPVENSISSNVHQNIDLILNYGLKIKAEAYLNISYMQVALKVSDKSKINTLIVHPMAELQCKNFIEDNNYKIISAKSNSHAQKLLIEKNNPEIAAISTNILLDENKLEFTDSCLENFKNNQTRFLMVSKNLEDQKGDKASFLFTIKHEVGSLMKLLTVFLENNLNLTKIESRPIPGTDWEYRFWIDIELGSKNVDDVAKILSSKVDDMTLMGCYPHGKLYS